jgi:hypothetical protein
MKIGSFEIDITLKGKDVLTTIKVLSKKGSTMIYIKITILWYFTK